MALRSPIPVSVIIPVYNDPVGIQKVVRALLVQSYPAPAFEILVIDNGSTDQTTAVVATLQPAAPQRLRLLTEYTVRGSYAARNCGIAAAQGEVLAFTDADCVPCHTWIEAGITGLAEHAADYGAGHIHFTFQGQRPNLCEYYDSGIFLKQQGYITNGFGATANLFVHRRLFHAYGVFRGDLTSGGDYEFGQRVRQGGEKQVYLAEASVHHPARASWRAVQQKSQRIARGRKQLIQLGLRPYAPKQEAHDLLRKLRRRVCPDNAAWPQRPTSRQRYQLILMYQLLLWQQWWICYVR